MAHETEREGERWHTLTLSNDAVLVLLELFQRLRGETDAESITFAHPAEMIAFDALTCDLERIPLETFSPDYQAMLTAAGARIAAGFEGDTPGLGRVHVDENGAVTPLVNGGGD